MNPVACPPCGKRNRVPQAAAGTPACAVCHAPLPWIVDTGHADFDRAADAVDQRVRAHEHV